MPGRAHTTNSRITLHDVTPETRSSGEHVPQEYPHLYRIKAGDWRISYAVEHNRLAILVLEVVSADEENPSKDTAREEMSKIIKVKLLDLPEDPLSRDAMPAPGPQRAKIRLVDLSEEASPDEGSDERSRPRPPIRVSSGSTSNSVQRPEEQPPARKLIKLLD